MNSSIERLRQSLLILGIGAATAVVALMVLPQVPPNKTPAEGKLVQAQFVKKKTTRCANYGTTRGRGKVLLCFHPKDVFPGPAYVIGIGDKKKDGQRILKALKSTNIFVTFDTLDQVFQIKQIELYQEKTGEELWLVAEGGPNSLGTFDHLVVWQGNPDP